MAVVALNDIFLVVTKGVMNGQACWNTFHYRLNTMTIPAPSTVTAAANLNTALGAANGLYDRLTQCSPDNFTIEQVDIQVISPTRFIKSQHIPAFANGQVGSDAVTSNLMASLTRRGEIANRSNIGGIRVAAPTSALEASTGEWQVGYKVLLDNLADELQESVVFNGGDMIWGPGIFGPYQNPTFKPITNTAFSEVVRVMRRRTKGYGI